MSATETTSIGIQASGNFSDARVTEHAFIRKLVWAYFFLLVIGEGVLRKWVLPSLSEIILIIRDPLVIWIYYLAYAQGLFPTENKYVQKVFQWTVVAVAATLLFNGGHLFSIAYGVHSNLLHFPLIFIIGRVLTGRDVILFGQAFLLLALPMTWLMTQQFQADREDIMNVAAGGTGYQLETSGGKVRASGTFTFVSGPVFYFCFTMAYLIHGFLDKNSFPKWLLYLGGGATFLAMVTAGSRALIAESLQVVACFGFLAYFRPHEFGKITAAVFGFSTIALILYTQMDLFKEGLDFLSLRFEEAANVEGTPIEAYFNRYWQILSAPYKYNEFTPLLGNNGLGSATRAGSALAERYGADFKAGGAEISWSRPILENGVIVGTLFIAWRVWLAFDLLKICIKAINRGNYLAIFLFGAAGPIILFGLLGQPTNLGFAAFGGGLCLAAARAKTFT
jgi:hypothetical protein